MVIKYVSIIDTSSRQCNTMIPSESIMTSLIQGRGGVEDWVRYVLLWFHNTKTRILNRKASLYLINKFISEITIKNWLPCIVCSWQTLIKSLRLDLRNFRFEDGE